jgi:hypothetical protein
VKRLGALILLVGAAGTLGLLDWMVRHDRYADFNEPVFVNIPHGTSSWHIGEQLTEASGANRRRRVSTGSTRRRRRLRSTGGWRRATCF